MAETYEIRNSYAEFLKSKEWDYFATVTCRKPRKDSLAFVRDFSNLIGFARGFVAVEPHQTGMIHIHSLLDYREYWNSEGRAHGHPSAESIQSKFGRVFGRSRVSAINSREDVALYCAKYVLKSDRPQRLRAGDYEYDFLGDW